MHSEATGNHRARAVDYLRIAGVLLLALIVGACEAPSVIRATPQGSPEALLTPTPQATATPTSPAPVSASTRQIEHIAFATQVKRDGEPVQETSVFPETPEQMYLCVQVRNVALGTRFRAYWFSDGQIIGQSDALATRDDEVVWVALGYRPIAALSPTSEHSVELQIDTQTIDRYLFRVGVGDAKDVVAQAAFASGFDAAGKPVDVRNAFPEDTTELRVLARISRQVDSTGMIFTSIWYRGDTAIAYVNPETVVPEDSPDATATPASGVATATPARVSTVLSFTYTPGSALPRGDYRVSLLLNGTEVRSIPFVVGSDAAGTAPDDDGPDTEDRPNDGADTAAKIAQLVITAEIDGETSEPAAVNIWVWEAGVRETQTLYATFSIDNLYASNDVRVKIDRDGDEVDEIDVDHGDVESGWVAAEFEISTPRHAGRMFKYTVTVEINGDVAAERSFEVWAVAR